MPVQPPPPYSQFQVAMSNSAALSPLPDSGAPPRLGSQSPRAQPQSTSPGLQCRRVPLCGPATRRRDAPRSGWGPLCGGLPAGLLHCRGLTSCLASVGQKGTARKPSAHGHGSKPVLAVTSSRPPALVGVVDPCNAGRQPALKEVELVWVPSFLVRCSCCVVHC